MFFFNGNKKVLKLVSKKQKKIQFCFIENAFRMSFWIAPIFSKAKR